MLNKLSQYIKMFLFVSFVRHMIFGEFDTVVREIREEFSPTQRDKILQILLGMKEKKPKETLRAKAMRKQIEDIWAMLPDDMPQYTDAELDEMKNQRRLEKYG